MTHTQIMPSVQIKNVPPDVHAELRARAAKRHQSLQEYLLDLLIKETSYLTAEEVLARVETRSGGSVPPDVAAAIIREHRGDL